MPDPFVLTTAGGYYLFSSQTGFRTPPVSVSFSTDPFHWPASHSALSKLPPWAVSGFTWAPDVRRIDGRYVLYFDAWAKPSMFYEPWLKSLATHAQCIGTAVARHPAGPFRAEPAPLVCMFDHHGAIDPRTFRAPGGELFLDWKSDDNANFETATSVTHLFAERLSRNGLGLVGEQFQLMQADRPWENRIVEAPDMVYAHKAYWLFFSGNWFNQPGYAIGVARCARPTGPCVDRPAPLLASTPQGQGPGEESLFEVAGHWWMVYSAWFDGYRGRHYRPVAVTRIAFGRLGPHLVRS
jgi:arabinan endo-1,5-alpha-L-arabinosidase